MAKAQATFTDHQYPLLYWLTLAYIVSMPNFIHFDMTGRISNPFNFTSIAMTVQTLVSGYLLVVMLLLERRPLIYRRINISLWLWVVLFLQFALASLLQPEFHLAPPARIDLLLSFYYLCQWAVAFLLVVALYSRTSPQQATELMVRLIGRACWIWIAMVWIVLPIMPAQVYGGSDESSTPFRQLGGQFVHPGKLAMLAGVGFFYALFFFSSRPRKWLACLLALITMALTSARTGELSFVIALLLYAFVFSGKTVLRWGTIFILVPVAVIGSVFSSSLMQYVARGQSAQSLASLDDRTRIWEASWEAIKLRPLLGYGYTVGARRALRDHWTFVHWIPPHAHNELIQSQVDGGVIAVALVIYIYALVLWKATRNARRGHNELFILIVYWQLLVTTVSGPILSYRYETLGGILLLCFIGVLGGGASTSDQRSLDKRVGSANAGLHVTEPQFEAR
ncbi:O-antigen ligase family protein [Granulicella sp. dw_53]|uniref:O-antigen ligase family protein n=1 Tax=Granulicella sp. dw_53 TaxID=2719792 RepID=UPI001BD538CD|nr:O-antigen ligase family protein [Granulicella sp. dw_53]